MPSEETIANPPAQKQASVRLLTILAFAAIYVIWGSTFLAIRIAVASVPPLFAAGVRFLFAGAVLYGWARLRGGPAPSGIEWRNLIVLSVFLFLIAYGGVFWAEQTTPSGIVSVLVSTIPLWTALLQIFIADISTSLDNVLAVAGAVRDQPPWVLFAGLGLSVVMTGFAATWIARFLHRMPWLGYLGLGIVLLVSGRMIWDGVEQLGWLKMIHA